MEIQKNEKNLIDYLKRANISPNPNKQLMNIATTSPDVKLKIKGWASYYNNTDYHGDVIVKGAFDRDIQLFNNHGRKIRLLYQHQTHQPIANITKLEDREEGLWVEAEVFLKDTGREKFTQLESDLVGEMSIGIIPRDSYNSKGNRFIKEATLIEVSVVTIGANPQAKILSVEKCME